MSATSSPLVVTDTSPDKIAESVELVIVPQS
jgi:hypothetical protein